MHIKFLSLGENVALNLRSTFLSVNYDLPCN